MKLPKLVVRTNDDGTYSAGYYGFDHEFTPLLKGVGLVAAIVYAATANRARLTVTVRAVGA